MNDFIITFDPTLQDYWGWWITLGALVLGIFAVGIASAIENSKPKLSDFFGIIFVVAVVVFVSSVLMNLLGFFLFEPENSRRNAVEAALLEEGFDLIEPVEAPDSGVASEWFLGRDSEIRHYNSVYVTLDGDDEMRFFEVSR